MVEAKSDSREIASQPEYIEFEQKHNRHLNMMTENDRNLRRQALVEFNKLMEREKNDAIIEYFYREKLARRLVISLEDQIEKNRELTIEILTKAIERVGLKEESQILLPAIASRMNKTPYAESSEEVRIQLIDLMDVCLDSDKQTFHAHLGPISAMMARAGQDSNPEMKQRLATFAGKICRELKDKSGVYMKGTVVSLAANLAHQHSKVRKVTLKGLQDVVVAKGAEQYLEDALPQLKYSMNDRSQDVRSIFFSVLRHWMTNMEIQSLRSYEDSFVLFLLNGISDENEEISQSCRGFLEEHGRRMKEALAMLDEEDDATMASQ